MANGAAGCGFEHRNTGGMCGHLTTKESESGVLTQFGDDIFRKVDFICMKFSEKLETQRTTGEPFRCNGCIKSVSIHSPSKRRNNIKDTF